MHACYLIKIAYLVWHEGTGGSMNRITNYFSSRWGIIGTGAFIGVVAALLQRLGNPGNMGVCVACFERDTMGALGFHRADLVQYIRPEIIGFVLGSLIAAYLFKEFRPRGGSSPVVRFMLGVFAMIGALVFLGCPWRSLLRLAGGDWNAVLGILGLAAGIGIGALFLRSGYDLGRSNKTSIVAGWIMPLMMLGLLALLFAFPICPGAGVQWYPVLQC
jgi:YedE family putative selenium metabolism protein